MKTRLLLFATVLCFSFGLKAQQEPADKIYQQALQTAKKEKKNVLLIFHASWCGWCKKMEKNLNNEQVKPLMDKNYVTTYLSVLERGENIAKYENPGGQDLMAKLGGKDAGLPYWVILDGNGKVLDNSYNDKHENLGAPSAPEEIVALGEKLKKTSKLNPTEIETIKTVFTPEKKS